MRSFWIQLFCTICLSALSLDTRASGAVKLDLPFNHQLSRLYSVEGRLSGQGVSCEAMLNLAGAASDVLSLHERVDHLLLHPYPFAILNFAEKYVADADKISLPDHFLVELFIISQKLGALSRNSADADAALLDVRARLNQQIMSKWDSAYIFRKIEERGYWDAVHALFAAETIVLRARASNVNPPAEHSFDSDLQRLRDLIDQTGTFLSRPPELFWLYRKTAKEVARLRKIKRAVE